MKSWILFTAVLLLFSGCVREEISSSRMALGTREQKKYAPLDKAKLSLEISRNRTLAAGGKGELTFVLVNEGNEPIEIKEWYSNEPDNIIISCQNWLPGMTSYDPNPDAWVKLQTPVKKPAWRYPLQLAPGNRVSVSKNLDFVSKLSVTSGSERRYFVRAELNLTSVKAVSKVASISVRNADDMKRKNAPASGGSRHFNR